MPIYIYIYIYTHIYIYIPVPGFRCEGSGRRTQLGAATKLPNAGLPDLSLTTSRLQRQYVWCGS